MIPCVKNWGDSMLVRIVILATVAINLAAAEARAEWAPSLRSYGLSTCKSGCQQQGGAPAACSAYCDCTIAELENSYSYEQAMEHRALNSEDVRRITAIGTACAQRTLGR
jgi:uncharacterized membrane protein